MTTTFWIWMAVALVFLILELATPTMVFVCFTAGAAAAGIYGQFYPEAHFVQGGIFAVVSVALIPFMRKFAKRITKPSPQLSNVDRLIGSTATVTQKIDPDTAGKIRFESEIWSAIADESIPPESKVRILSVSGTKLKVERADRFTEERT